MSNSRRRRTEQEEQVDSDNNTGLGISKMYSNVIFHYITEPGTQQLY